MEGPPLTAVVIRNVLNDEDLAPATRPDGARYRFEMIFQQGHSRAYADTAEDLMDVLAPGYAGLSQDEQVTARTRHATDLLAPLQAQVLHAHPGPVSEEEQEVLLSARHVPLEVGEWGSAVPLVLVDVHYRPYSDIPAPTSALADVTDPPNIIWLRPADPYDYLVSLARAGVVVLSESNDFRV